MNIHGESFMMTTKCGRSARKIGRETALLITSANSFSDETCCGLKICRATTSLRKYASRRTCFVFLNATGSKHMSIADFESSSSGVGPTSSASTSSSASVKYSFSSSRRCAYVFSFSRRMADRSLPPCIPCKQTAHVII